MKAISNFFILSMVVISTTMFFSGCTVQPSEAVDQDRIYTQYELFYDKNEDKTHAKATFKFGGATGTLLQLSKPSSIMFNNDSLLYNVLGFYEKIYPGFINSGNFIFKDKAGKTFTNSAPLVKTVEFPADPSVIPLSKTKDYEIKWVGDPLGPNEGVGGLVGTTLQAFLQTNLNATSVTIFASQLQQANPGPYIIYLERSTVSNLVQQTSVGGNITSKYRGLSKNAELK